MLIYTPHITPRITFTFDLVFKTILNTEYEVTSNVALFKISTLPKFAYANENEGFDLFIKPDGLLSETIIRQELPATHETYINLPQFFTTTKSAWIPYDLFATVFYFATRYEEYIEHETDKHSRFKAEQSLAFKHGLLQIPFLNVLIQDFATKLTHQFPQLAFKKRTFNFLSTIDIDNAFAYAHKGLKRNIGGLLKDSSSFKFNAVAKRITSNLNSAYDPYNTFDIIHQLTEKATLQYFVLIGDYAEYDKNPHYQNAGFRELIKNLASNHTVGLHPSYESFNHLEKIDIEKKRIEDIIEKKITSARCHFLRIKFPETYRAFIEAGITDDYTMIYASQSGFRTGLCTPYKWFDLQKNLATDLTIHPSTVMEGTLRDYNKLSPQQATDCINKILNEVKTQGGEFISIWHNDSFVKEQQEWIDVYKKMLSS